MQRSCSILASVQDKRKKNTMERFRWRPEAIKDQKAAMTRGLQALVGHHYELLILPKRSTLCVCPPETTHEPRLFFYLKY